MSFMSLALAFHACRKEARRGNGQIFTHIFSRAALTEVENVRIAIICVKNAKDLCKVDLHELNGKSCAVL